MTFLKLECDLRKSCFNLFTAYFLNFKGICKENTLSRCKEKLSKI